MILPSQWQRSFKCTAIRYVTDTGLNSLKSAPTRCLRRGKLLPRSLYWMDALVPENHAAPPPATLTSVSVASFVRYPFRTPQPLAIRLFPLASSWLPPKGASSRTKDQCLSDLGQIFLYFCLGSSEYAKTNSHRRTTKFCLRNIQFQYGCGTIPFDSPTSHLLNALVVTLFLDTHKSFVLGE